MMQSQESWDGTAQRVPEDDLDKAVVHRDTDSTTGGPSTGEPTAMSTPLLLLIVFSVLGGFLFGYDTGVVSGATVFVQESMHFTSFELECVVSFTVGAAAIAAALSGYPMQQYGRRPLILLASVLYVLGGVCVGIAPGLVVLLIGRTLLGAGVGISSITVPVYIAEVAPSELRGQLVALNNSFIVLGQLIACGINILCDEFLTGATRWRVSMGLAAVPAVIQTVGFLGLPESPRWLAQVNRREEALAVLKALRGPKCSQAQVDADLAAIDQASQSEGPTPSLKEIWRDRKLRRIFGLGMGLMALQQLSGINTMMYYGAVILVMVGLPDSLSIELAAVLALTQLIAISVSMPLFDKIGRRALMLPSLVGAGCSLTLVGLSFFDIDRFKYMAIVGVFTYLLSFGSGLSSGPWVVNSEIYPLSVRGVGNAAAISTNWVFNFVISLTFLTLCNTIGRPATFLTLAVLSFVGVFWLYSALPETRGLTLEEIEGLFEDHDTQQFEKVPTDEDSEEGSVQWPSGGSLASTTSNPIVNSALFNNRKQAGEGTEW